MLGSYIYEVLYEVHDAFDATQRPVEKLTDIP